MEILSDRFQLINKIKKAATKIPRYAVSKFNQRVAEVEKKQRESYFE